MTSFENIKISVMIFFTSILNDRTSTYHRFSFFELIFITAHEILFCERSSDEFNTCFNQIRNNLLDNYIDRVTTKFKKQKTFVIIVCIASLFEYKSIDESDFFRSIFRFVFEKVQATQIKKQKTISMRANDKMFDVNDLAICFS